MTRTRSRWAEVVLGGKGWRGAARAFSVLASSCWLYGQGALVHPRWYCSAWDGNPAPVHHHRYGQQKHHRSLCRRC